MFRKYRETRSICAIDSPRQVICREEAEAKIAAAKQIEAKLAKVLKRRNAKVKAQQAKLAATALHSAPPVAASQPSPSQPSLEPSNAYAAGTARSKSNASDVTAALSAQDTFQLPGQRQLDSGTKLSPGSAWLPTENNIQDSSSGKAPAMQASGSPPARAASEALSMASLHSDSIPAAASDDGPWLNANAKARQASLKPAAKAGQSTDHVSFGGQSSQRSHASSAAAAAATGGSGHRTPSPASQPRENVECFLRGMLGMGLFLTRR